MYVNYGRTEDFFQLEREMGINVTGKIVIARYGKIFRGNKVWKVSSHSNIAINRATNVLEGSAAKYSPNGFLQKQKLLVNLDRLQVI